MRVNATDSFLLSPDGPNYQRDNPAQTTLSRQGEKRPIMKTFNPQQPNVFGVTFRLRETRRIIPIILRNFKLWKMPKLLNFKFPDGLYF